MNATNNKVLMNYKVTLYGSHFVQANKNEETEIQKLRDVFSRIVAMDDNITIEHMECSVDFEDINMIQVKEEK